MTANPDHVLVLIMAGLLFVGWDGFCLYDLARAKEARFLPKSVWAIITLISFPLGGILYMLIGRDWDRSDARLPGGRTPQGRDLSDRARAAGRAVGVHRAGPDLSPRPLPGSLGHRGVSRLRSAELWRMRSCLRCRRRLTSSRAPSAGGRGCTVLRHCPCG